MGVVYFRGCRVIAKVNSIDLLTGCPGNQPYGTPAIQPGTDSHWCHYNWLKGLLMSDGARPTMHVSRPS
ncbi:hypothetical protein WJX77_006125 [Trebouxia sp. C0004]